MNNRLSLSDLAGLLAAKTGKTKKESEMFLREFVSIVSEGAFTDRIVKVSGLGTFKVIRVEDRESVNVNTGERFIIPGHYRFNFTPDKELKELVNKPFSFFETTEISDGADFTEVTSTEEEENIETPSIEEDIEEIPEEQPAQEEAQIEEQEVEELEEPIIKEEPLPEALIETTPEKEEVPEVVENKLTTQVKAKSKRILELVVIVLVVIVIATGVYIYTQLDMPAEAPAVVEQAESITEPLLMTEAVNEEENIEASPEEIDNEQQKEEEPQEAQSEVLTKIKIEPGSRLTLVALEHYGHKIFWVYIYLHNKAIIKDPNNIPIGTELVVPVPTLYDIDIKDRASIEKATALQTEILAGQM